MQTFNDIYGFITSEENNYSQPINILENWTWSMRDHIAKTILYKNSTYTSGKDDDKPFKNITRPILNVQYRAEGFDVKDIELFVDDPKNYYKSFLVRKYHQKWAREHKVDTFIDAMVESYVDFGGALVKKIKGAVPEVVPLKSIVFCDQTSILSGPIAIKHFYSPAELRKMRSSGWGEEKNGATISIDDLIKVSTNENIVKDKVQGVATHIPGKYIEIYEVHGEMPKKFLDADDNSWDYVNQIQIVAFQKDKNGTNGNGVTLFAKEESESPFKLILRDEIFGRAMGLGGAEELFEPQVWVNYDVIRIKEMLDTASKILFKTDDPAFIKRNKINNLDNGEVLTIEEGKQFGQIDTYPRNMALFDSSIARWEAHAQQMGSANESIMGEQPKSGTPFALQQLVTAENHSLHEYRKGKLATFLDEIYKDWIIPHISKEVTKEQVFLAELDLEEMQEIMDNMAGNDANDFIKKRILAGQMIERVEVESVKEQSKVNFKKKGSKQFLKILEGEMKDAPLSVRLNIAGKQEYLSRNVDKLVNVFRTISSNPQILTNPSMAKLFNEIIEYSGLSPVDFSGFKTMPAPQGQALNQPAPEMMPATQ